MLKRAFNLRPLSLSSLLHFKKHNRVEKDVQEKESTWAKEWREESLALRVPGVSKNEAHWKPKDVPKIVIDMPQNIT